MVVPVSDLYRLKAAYIDEYASENAKIVCKVTNFWRDFRGDDGRLNLFSYFCTEFDSI